MRKSQEIRNLDVLQLLRLATGTEMYCKQIHGHHLSIYLFIFKQASLWGMKCWDTR